MLVDYEIQKPIIDIIFISVNLFFEHFQNIFTHLANIFRLKPQIYAKLINWHYFFEICEFILLKPFNGVVKSSVDPLLTEVVKISV